VTKRKPDTEGFQKMIKLSGVETDEVLYVGDRIDVDVKPAKQIGMLTCLAWSNNAGADYNAPTFVELKEIVSKLA
jgi:FMN phosphatase YigB (HAD superfamily)